MCIYIYMCMCVCVFNNIGYVYVCIYIYIQYHTHQLLEMALILQGIWKSITSLRDLDEPARNGFGFFVEQLFVEKLHQLDWEWLGYPESDVCGFDGKTIHIVDPGLTKNPIQC